MLLVDTSAWVELIKGAEKGEQVMREIAANPCFVTSESMAEIAKWCFGHGFDAEEKSNYVAAAVRSVLYMDRKTERRAGEICSRVNKGRKRSIGLIDCIIAAIAEQNDLTIISFDRDFSDIGVKAKIIK